MKRNLILLITLFLVCVFSTSAMAGDIYVQYAMQDPNGRLASTNTNIYLKNGNMRMDLAVAVNQMNFTTTSLILKNNPEQIIIFSSLAQSYTKTVKPKRNPSLEAYTITIVGKGKVGKYNCTHVRVKSKDKLWDMWFTKDLPSLNLPIENNEFSVNKKLATELEQKGVAGMMVKAVYFNPGSTTPKLTMVLKKYETKPLSASLFKIPSNYKESKGNPFKDISPEKKKEMMNQMMEQLKKNK